MEEAHGLHSDLIIVRKAGQQRFFFEGGTRRPHLVVIQSIENCSYYSRGQQKVTGKRNQCNAWVYDIHVHQENTQLGRVALNKYPSYLI